MDLAQGKSQRNVLGEELQVCCTSPVTGFYRNGKCETGSSDRGLHVVCAQMTQEFLEYTAQNGNDLSSPAPHFGFPGLKAGDKWCLCASRWRQAYDVGKAPPVMLEATHEKALEVIPLEVLQAHAVQ